MYTLRVIIKAQKLYCKIARARNVILFKVALEFRAGRT